MWIFSSLTGLFWPYWLIKSLGEDLNESTDFSTNFRRAFLAGPYEVLVGMCWEATFLEKSDLYPVFGT